MNKENAEESLDSFALTLFAILTTSILGVSSFISVMAWALGTF